LQEGDVASAEVHGSGDQAEDKVFRDVFVYEIAEEVASVDEPHQRVDDYEEEEEHGEGCEEAAEN